MVSSRCRVNWRTTLAGVLVVLSPSTALFSCFEWPSMLDPEQTVRYLSSDNCSHDGGAMAEVLNISLEAVQCTNSAGMLSFGTLCDAAVEALAEAGELPDAVNVTCDGGYLVYSEATTCNEGAAALNLAIHNYTAPPTTTAEPRPDRNSSSDTTGDPLGAGAEPGSGGSGGDTGFTSLFQEDRGPTWIAVVVGIGLGSLMTFLSLVFVAAKLVLKNRRRKAFGYSGADELGFHAAGVKDYNEFQDPEETAKKAAKASPGRWGAGTGTGLRGGPSNSALGGPDSGTEATVRYHHHDWCADLQTKAHLYGVNGRSPGSGSAAYPKKSRKAKKLLKKAKATVRSASTDFSSDSEIDNSLLLY